jgi:hypothetical protein
MGILPPPCRPWRTAQHPRRATRPPRPPRRGLEARGRARLAAAAHGVRLGGGAIDAISDGIGATADKATDVLLSLFSSGREKPVAEEKEQQKGMTPGGNRPLNTPARRSPPARRTSFTAPSRRSTARCNPMSAMRRSSAATGNDNKACQHPAAQQTDTPLTTGGRIQRRDGRGAFRRAEPVRGRGGGNSGDCTSSDPCGLARHASRPARRHHPRDYRARAAATPDAFRIRTRRARRF